MKCRIFVIALLAWALPAKAQLSAFTNLQNQFMVWDNGMIRKIEYLLPAEYQVGRIAIPYIDNSRNFKIYANGGVTKINDGFTNSFKASENLVTFLNARSLNVWDNGKITNLSKYCEQYLLGDSLVLFFDGVQREYRAYYGGQVYTIEGFLAGASFPVPANDSVAARVLTDRDIASGQLPSIKVAANLAAYINYANQFHIFYKGEILDQEDFLINSFDVGRNTVAYLNQDNEFKVFHKGTTTTIDNFAPYEYAAGDDLVAYIDRDNYFKIFYQDSIYSIGFFQPDFLVKDNIVAFRDATGYFKVFYKGHVYTLESYYPRSFKASYHSLAYVNQANVLRVFTEGETYDVTEADIASWRLDYDVVQYRFGSNMYKVFYKGKTY